MTQLGEFNTYYFRRLVPLPYTVRKYISSTRRHLRFSYISILTNLLRTDNETESVKTISIKRHKITKSRLKRNIKMQKNQKKYKKFPVYK